MILTLLSVSIKEVIIAIEIWSIIEMRCFGDQNFFDMLAVVNNNGRCWSQNQTNNWTKFIGQIIESLIRHFIALQWSQITNNW